MTTYRTNNPFGSMDPKDLFDNSQNLDYALNDITKSLWTDRLGRVRKSYWGMEQAFSAQLISQQQRFNYFIQNSGYKVIGEYTQGPLTVTDYNQLIRYQSEFYKLNSSTSIPFTTTGNDSTSWSNDSSHFVSVGDAAIRQELSGAGGSGLIGDLLKPITWDGFSGGAAWDGVTNDNIPYQAAAQYGRKFLMPYGVGNITEYSVGLFAPNFSVLGEAEQLGSLQYPVDDFRPSRTDTKYSKYHETDPASNRWDSCSIHTIVKCPQDGANPKGNAAAVTGYARAINSEGGDHVGVHGRAEGDTSYDFGTGMGLWGGWLSAVYRPNTGSAGKPIKSIIGCEIDVQNDGPHAQNPNPDGVGELRGLAVGNTGAGHLNQGVDVFSSNRGARGRWWMGVHVRTDSIVGRHLVSTEGEVGNAMVIAGAASSGSRYGGLKFSKYPYTAVGKGGHLSYGIDFREATIRLQNAIVMGPQHRITWEPDTAKGVAVETEGGDVITFRGYNIAINNSKVLGTRQTGIFNMSGTADGTSYNTETVTLVNLARYLKKVTDALIFHGLIGPT